MTLPTFSPTINPSYSYSESPELLVDTVQMHKGYDQSRPLLIRPVRRRVKLTWKIIPESVKDYIESFIQGLGGTNGPFWWTPIDKVPSPSGIAPTVSQFSGGSIGWQRYNYVRFTWYDSSYGETMESAQSSILMLANYYLRVQITQFPTFCEGWRVYVHETSGSECLQDTITDSRTWEQDSVLSTGTATPPSSNTLSVPVKWLLSGGMNKTKITAGRWSVDLEFIEQIF